MADIVLRFDMRQSPLCNEAVNLRYRAAIEMAVWADSHDIPVVGFSEHHNTGDGFLSSPLTMASMVAAQTQNVLISVSALLVNMHNPLRLAEDIAVMDLIAGGRFVATAGLGYRESEYAMMGADWARRGKLLEENIQLILRAWQGEPYEHNGTTVQLKPVPLSRPRNILMMGGNSRLAARRAARLKMIFNPGIDDPQLDTDYQAACKEYGFDRGAIIFPRAPATTLLSDDPDAAWETLGPYLLYDATAYGAWAHPNRRAYAVAKGRTLEELKNEGKYRIITPEAAIETLNKGKSLHLAPLCGGLPVSVGWESLRLFADRVRPFLTV